MAKLLMVEEYAFCAAHRVSVFPDGSRDAGMHGHTWTIAFEVEVDVGDGTGDGYAFDHSLLDEVAAGVLRKIDHKVVNDIRGLERGLNEDLAILLGIGFMVTLSTESAPAKLTRVRLTQFGSGQTFRLTKHVTEWRPTSDDQTHAERMAKALMGAG